MALQVLFAHSGQRLQTDGASFSSIDAFRTWVARHGKIAVHDQITLTAQGKSIKFQGLSTETEIFVYDRRIIQPSSHTSPKSLLSEVPLPAKFNVSKPPDTITDQNDLQAWKDLFMARRSWALNLTDDCMAMSNQAQQRYSEIEVMTRGVEAAVINLERHVRGLDQRNAEMQSLAADIEKEQDLAGSDWEASLTRLRSLPATIEMIKFIKGSGFRLHQSQPTLEDLVEVEQIRKAGKTVKNITSQLSRNGPELGTIVDEILRRTDDLFEKFEKSPGRALIGRPNAAKELMEDIEPMAKKVSNDYENILGLSNTPKNISQASKSALLHTKNFLPTLAKRALEMDGLLRPASEDRNLVAASSTEIMHEIALVTTMVAEVAAKFTAIELNGDTFEAFHLLSMANSLPVTYASFMAEAIRRREWNEKVKADSSTLANEMAAFQDEEAKRRRRWQKNTGASLWGEKAERKVIGLEVNLLGDDEELPPVTRQDLELLLQILQEQDGKSIVATDVSKIIADLNNPTKQQSKRAKAFKNGSIHEAALGRSALLMRGDNDLIRILQEEKQKTESKLKTAESRVRRLEDLLHRQTHISRTSTGNVFQASGLPSPDPQHIANPMASPRLQDDLSRRSSVSSRRFSANQGADEKAFQQKLLSLEAELIAERERASGLETEISMRKGQVEEADSNKKDLMENFLAQQTEFAAERKSFQEEINRLKLRLEELEDEIERNLGSRENEKMTVDDRVHSLLEELDQVKKEALEETQKAHGQVEYLRNEAQLQQETNDSLEAQLQKVREENKMLLARATKAETLAEEQAQALLDVHALLSPSKPAPEDPTALAEILVDLATGLVAEVKTIKSDAALAKADRDKAQVALASITTEMQLVKEQLSAEEIEKVQLQESLAREQAKFTAVETELNDERSQLSALRLKVANGETGSKALQSRLEDEERKVTSISADLAIRQSKIGALEEELRAIKEKHKSAQTKHEKLSSRFDARTSRAKDLTQRLYAQNDRLCALLERLSYSVTREGGSMIIQRIPKPERTNANDSSDPSSSIRRSISGALTTRKAMLDSGDLDLLYWMHNDDSETESEKYDAYLNAVGNFDVEAFCEVITKRIKDIEYTAKKYSKDARAYRDKSHAAQKEAHEKIAFKNFKEGDLALFLPTRNQATGAWAAFNVGAPHYFLREQESHKLRTRDWLLARIHKISDRVVDLSKSMTNPHPNDNRSFDSSLEDDNPFDLSDGLRWYLIDAAEEKPGAPSTPGLGKTTVASTNVDAMGSVRRSKKSGSSKEQVSKTLSKSLDSRRSSGTSKKSVPASVQLREAGIPAPPHNTDTASIRTTQASGSGDVGMVGGGEMSNRSSVVESVNGAGIGGLGQNGENSNVVSRRESLVGGGDGGSGNQTPTPGTPTKRSVIWDSLWSLDLSLESGKRRR